MKERGEKFTQSGIKFGSGHHLILFPFTAHLAVFMDTPLWYTVESKFGHDDQIIMIIENNLL